ncbi:MAG TPA: hypothetical protein VJT49_28335 [Amycolatopsis sp.]|uniref:hypothetical protein n=1 Tax=Amycolatopsis sp. TaxID=37632 RepID=UPI002B47434F|nr:hypothetical protein [Amycolatopsis sp.]HKS48946.1 hypothetical protein [Amycolatopsis sp.]
MGPERIHIPAHVSLDDVGLGAPYILGPGEGEQNLANNTLRTMLTRAADTDGDLAAMVCSGDVAVPTVAHVHRETTEAVFVLDGLVRVLLDDQKGTKIVKDLKEGEFGLLPRNWIHSWAFAAPRSRFMGMVAPDGFENVVHFLEPDKPPTAERLRESEKHVDVLWFPDYPLFGDFGDLPAPGL